MDLHSGRDSKRCGECSFTGAEVFSPVPREYELDRELEKSRVLKMKGALQWDPQVSSFSEEKLKMMLLLSKCCEALHICGK